MAGKIRVAIVEDHPLVLQAVRQQLRGQRDISVVLELSHGSRLLGALRRQAVDVVLMDLGMDVGVFDPVSTVRRLRKLFPDVRVIVMSSHTYGETALGVLRSGVHAYVTKNDLLSLDMAEVIRRALSGERVYSPAIIELQAVLMEADPDGSMLDGEEREMLNLAAQGHTNRQIGYLLGYSEKTVRNRFTPIFRKLGAVNRVDAIRKAQKMGILAEGWH